MKRVIKAENTCSLLWRLQVFSDTLYVLSKERGIFIL